MTPVKHLERYSCRMRTHKILTIKLKLLDPIIRRIFWTHRKKSFDSNHTYIKLNFFSKQEPCEIMSKVNEKYTRLMEQRHVLYLEFSDYTLYLWKHIDIDSYKLSMDIKSVRTTIPNQCTLIRIPLFTFL